MAGDTAPAPQAATKKEALSVDDMVAAMTRGLTAARAAEEPAAEGEKFDLAKGQNIEEVFDLDDKVMAVNAPPTTSAPR